MDVIRGDGTLLHDIDLAPKNAYQEVIQNIAVILDLIQKSCPMFRDGGLPGNLLGRPMNVVENILIGSIYDQIEEYEPRAIIAAITFEQNALTGAMIPIIELEGVADIE
ncbi:MAG: hypothetical protein NC245_03190 [Muribaculum sp.]|nr:hypothetical protein [Muribaculum sp.]